MIVVKDISDILSAISTNNLSAVLFPIPGILVKAVTFFSTTQDLKPSIEIPESIARAILDPTPEVFIRFLNNFFSSSVENPYNI